MSWDYLMPKLAMAMNEGTINEWLVKDGDHVKAGDTIVTVETEKVAYDLQSPETGYLRILVPQGETVNVEALIGRFLESPDEVSGASAEATGNQEVDSGRRETVQDKTEEIPAERIKASPVVRKLARENGIDLTSLTGSGPGGRIVKRDIVNARESLQTQVKPGATDAGDSSGMISPAAVLLPGTTRTASLIGSPAELARYAIKGTTRGTIAKRMLESIQHSAQLSSAWETDLTELMRIRKSFLAREQELGTRVSVNAFLIKAMVYAIRRLPLANSALIGDEVIIYDDINVGIAVAMPGQNEYDSSLLVPVLKQVQSLGVIDIDKRMKVLIAAAQNRNLGADDMTGSTITLSSTAGIAPPGNRSTPVLNTPNTMIIGPSTPADKVIAVAGEMQIRRMLPMSVTFDHRILDGEPASRFMSALHEAIEHPELMLG